MRYPKRPLVIIPTYNERDNIAQLIPVILSVDSRLHILIVDDGSPDKTAGEVLNLRRNGSAPRLFLQSRPEKLGLGSAYVQGLKWGLAGGYDFMIQMDADWSHHPRYLKSMLQLAEEYDFVIGSRYVSGGGTYNWGVGRKLLSRFASIYSCFILGVHFADFTAGFNGWSGKVLQAIRLDAIRCDGYSFQIELKYRAHRLGFTHTEFPIIFDERRAGKSKMSASIALEACWRVWQLRLVGKEANRRAAASQSPNVPVSAPAQKEDIGRDPAWIGENPD
jgi:dolichol-phosphate mannosyltransferase